MESALQEYLPIKSLYESMHKLLRLKQLFYEFLRI